MSLIGTRKAATAIGLTALCGYWAWALLSTPDSLLVLDRRIRLPLPGLDVPGGIFLIVTPVAALAVFLAARFRGKETGAAAAGLSPVLFLNAVRGLVLHDPVVSIAAAGLALAGTAAIFFRRSVSRSPGKSPRFTAKRLIGAGLIAGPGGALVLFLIPWSLRGDLPGKLNRWPVAPALRSLVYADLEGCVRSREAPRKSLRGIRLEGANLRRAVFRGADLREARLYRARMERADLEGSDLRSAGLVEARMSFVNLRKADLTGAVLSGVYSLGADLREAKLSGSSNHVQRFLYADARGAEFESAKLLVSQFFWSDLRGAVFRNAQLERASFVRARLEGADFSGASLPGSDFSEAVLRGVRFAGSDLSRAVGLLPNGLAGTADLAGAKLDAPLLEEMKKRYPGLFD